MIKSTVQSQNAGKVSQSLVSQTSRLDVILKALRSDPPQTTEVGFEVAFSSESLIIFTHSDQSNALREDFFFFFCFYSSYSSKTLLPHCWVTTAAGNFNLSLISSLQFYGD